MRFQPDIHGVVARCLVGELLPGVFGFADMHLDDGDGPAAAGRGEAAEAEAEGRAEANLNAKLSGPAGPSEGESDGQPVEV